MNTIMNDLQIDTLEKVRRFLEGTAEIDFSIDTKEDRYAFIQRTLIRFGYNSLSKADKGLLLCFLARVSGYSRVQVKRLAARYLKHGRVRRGHAAMGGFARKYTDADCRLLARTDELHGTLSGPATKKICERALILYGQAEYARLASISVSHLYNLRRSRAYQRCRRRFEKTRPKPSVIGERRQPAPDGRPGYIRVDTVHQGDLDKVKGVYHINAVDEVTQFEIVCSTEKISERFLIPVLARLLEQFPFVIKGFHADNGSEYINRAVVRLLNKLLIELTKSRARQSNDNALVECKNGAVVRKHLGYVHIPQQWAPTINRFTLDFLNPYLNYHRPCFFPEITTDKKGKQVKRYPYHCMMTPYEKLKSLPNAKQTLKPGVSFRMLDEIAHAISDNEAAKQLNEAKRKLFNSIFEQKHSVT
jgi:transposase InsO family protein